MRKVFLLSTISTLLLCFLVPLKAMDGTLDPSFNGTGFVTTVIGTVSNANTVVVQADGKIVVAGAATVAGVQQVALTRYNTDGSLDTSFNATGTVTQPIGTNSLASAVTLQPDGKILVAGLAFIAGVQQAVLMRYNTDGVLDTSFNAFGSIPGVVTQPVGTASSAVAVAVQTDGKIVIAGSAILAGLPQVLVARYNANGSLDTSFNSSGSTPGIITDPIGSFGSGASAVIIQADGKILVGGFLGTGGINRFAIIRYNTNGSVDTTFGPSNTGVVDTIIGLDSLINALVLQPDGKIVAGGSTNIAFNFQFALARYDVNGILDPSFNGTGVVTTNVGTPAQVSDLVLQADGKIVVAGGANIAGVGQFALARYTPIGTLDPSFNPSGTTPGIVTTPIGTFSRANSVALQLDGKIVAAGQATIGASQVAVARYLNTPALTPTEITFPTNGSAVTTTTPVIMGTAQNPSDITLFLDGVEQLPSTVTIGALNQWSYTPAVPLADGTYTLVAVSNYKSGHVNIISNSVTFTVDTVVPTPVIINPANGSTISTTTPTISGTVAPDAISVDIAIDGVLVASNVPVVTGAWSYTLSAAQALSNGLHQVSVVAHDAAGNTSAPAVSSFTVAAIIPVLTPPVIIQPTNGSVLNTRTPTISGFADDTAVAVQLFINSDPLIITVPVVNGVWGYTLTPAQALSEGFHSVVAVAINSAGAVSAPSNRVVFEVLTNNLSSLSAAIRAKYCNFLS